MQPSPTCLLGSGFAEQDNYSRLSLTSLLSLTRLCGKLDGALLSGTKVYEDGAKEKFKGVFINMTDIEGVSLTQIEHRATTFGLGVTGVRIEKDGVTSDKVFYQFKQ